MLVKRAPSGGRKSLQRSFFNRCTVGRPPVKYIAGKPNHTDRIAGDTFGYLNSAKLLKSWHSLQERSSWWLVSLLVAVISFVTLYSYWCAILIAHQIVMAKHGGSCVHFSGISTCGRTSRETVSHPQCPPFPTLCKISLPIYVIVTNKLLQPLTTIWYDSLVLSFAFLKI